MNKQKYTLGFIFDKELDKILLIKKNKSPKGLEGEMENKLNGLGGKLENNESIYAGITREVQEECGLFIDEFKWVNYCNLDAEFGYVYCFYTIIDSFIKTIPIGKNSCKFESVYKQMESESVGDYWVRINPDKHRWGDYTNVPHMANLDYLIPMALNHIKKLDNTKHFEIKEN